MNGILGCDGAHGYDGVGCESPGTCLVTITGRHMRGDAEAVSAAISRKPIRATVARLMRIEERPAGRGTIIVHEVDEFHPSTEVCDVCQLVIAGLVREPTTTSGGG